MSPIRHQVAQQRRAIDARSAIGDPHAGEIRLAGDGTDRAEEVGRQRFVDFRATAPQCGVSISSWPQVTASASSDSPASSAIRSAANAAACGASRRPARPSPRRGRARASRHRVGRRKHGLRERAEVELHRLRLHQRRRRRRHVERRDRDRRLAALVEPGELVGGPDVGAGERQRVAEAELRALRRACDAKSCVRSYVSG